MAPKPSKIDLGVFPAMLRLARKKLGYRYMGDFADFLGYERETYRRYERGEVEMNLAGLRRLRDRAGLDLNEVICGPSMGVPNLRPFPASAPTSEGNRSPRAPGERIQPKTRA